MTEPDSSGYHDSPGTSDPDGDLVALAAARSFTTQVLPRLSAERVVVENTDNALMEVDEAAL